MEMKTYNGCDSILEMRALSFESRVSRKATLEILDWALNKLNNDSLTKIRDNKFWATETNIDKKVRFDIVLYIMDDEYNAIGIRRNYYIDADEAKQGIREIDIEIYLNANDKPEAIKKAIDLIKKFRKFIEFLDTL
ncbi:MAG: hypothetical protein QXT00_09240 [Ignisphaera sp.]